jgi:hypothetical protein
MELKCVLGFCRKSLGLAKAKLFLGRSVGIDLMRKDLMRKG